MFTNRKWIGVRKSSPETTLFLPPTIGVSTSFGLKFLHALNQFGETGTIPTEDLTNGTDLVRTKVTGVAHLPERLENSGACLRANMAGFFTPS